MEVCPKLDHLGVNFLTRANIKTGIAAIRKSRNISSLTLTFDSLAPNNNLSFQDSDIKNVESFPNIRELEMIGFKPCGDIPSGGLELQILQLMESQHRD